MKHYIAMAVLTPLAILTAFALGQMDPDRQDVATPVLISGLWIAGALGIAGLVVWSVRDLHARRSGGETPETD